MRLTLKKHKKTLKKSFAGRALGIHWTFNPHPPYPSGVSLDLVSQVSKWAVFWFVYFTLDAVYKFLGAYVWKLHNPQYTPAVLNYHY